MKITLIGSTRFIESFAYWNAVLTRAGHLVYSVAQATTSFDKDKVPDPEVKLVLDAVHIAKIEESEAVFLISRDHREPEMPPYVGESTAREFYYAKLRDKRMFLDRNSSEGLSLNEQLSDNLFMKGRKVS